MRTILDRGGGVGVRQKRSAAAQEKDTNFSESGSMPRSGSVSSMKVAGAPGQSNKERQSEFERASI